MLKKALLAGVVGVFLASGAAFAGPGGGSGGGSGGGCPGDACQVSDPTKVEFGLDFRVDVDVCVDAGNLMDDFWSTQAVIYQDGNSNTASITQNDVSQIAGIVQEGNHNTATTSQSAAYEYAFTYQGGNNNLATITQTLNNAAAIAIQLGNHNSATINQ